jgi:hypothetical protein
MITVLSLVTSVKDYIEIAHKLIESQSGNLLFPQSILDNTSLINADGSQAGLLGSNTASFIPFKDYTELGAVLTYLVLSIKEFLTSFFSFTWLNQIWSLPLIVPDIASAMISEVSVLDSYFTNAFSFLETGLSNSNLNSTLTSENTFLYAFGKFITGLLNSLFLFLPTSTAHLITLRRFVIQGLEAGYIAGLGTIAGNFLWIASIILGWRFIVIPWLSFDIFRYILGFSLLVKYLWDSSKDFNKTTILEDNAKKKIFAFNFLLALTEQTSIYPFISNISFGSEGSVIESFSGTVFQSFAPNAHSLEFLTIHGCYLLGILLGSLSLLQFTVWFWENPAFSIYMWMITSYRVTTSSYYKVLNFIFLYLTMLCAISSIPYFGLDYTITNPLGLIPQDRIIDQKFTTANGPTDRILQETAFLGVNPTDKNTRIRDGLHARRERWKERLIKYQAFDASLYDQGTYDILTIEDLNYGFDRFWLRRKMRNHQIRFRLFPGPWMRSLKKQLNKPGFSGPRVEFFRILFEQYYHPVFHSTISNKKGSTVKDLYSQRNTSSMAQATNSQTGVILRNFNYAPEAINNQNAGLSSLYTPLTLNQANPTQHNFIRKGLIGASSENQQAQSSVLRKFTRNFNTRFKTSLLSSGASEALTLNITDSKPIYSKNLKYLFAKITKEYPKEKSNLLRSISRNVLLNKNLSTDLSVIGKNTIWSKTSSIRAESADSKLNNQLNLSNINQSLKKTNIRKKLSKKERLLLSLKMDFYKNINRTPGNSFNKISKTFSQVQTTQLTNNSPEARLEPLIFYLQKEEAYKRKFKYYSTTALRNLSIGNNAPYFKTLLKRAFYYHKPSLRWKRTMFTAAMRRGFRKKSSSPKKLLYTTNSLTIPETLTNSPEALSLKSEQNLNNRTEGVVLKTSSYSVLGKRASRYRYQIYKDVLQHWYYSPFNRLLLKFDIDSFINRQPKSHFLTKKEERLLHLRRLLLSEHYNSLRWYTYMEHYRTMKSRIGSTKSFASTAYNQQFQGTFKKIRHLFAITPVQGDMSILKFDQALYNESNLDISQANLLENSLMSTPEARIKLNSKQNLQKTPIYVHEENKPWALSQTSNVNEARRQTQDIIAKSLTVAGEYLKLDLNESAPSTRIDPLVNQIQSSTNASTAQQSKDTKEILLRLLKECKRRLNDQAFLKNYITHRLDKREQRSNEAQNELNKNIELFQKWLSPITVNTLTSSGTIILKDSKTFRKAGGFSKAAIQTTGARKSLNEGVFVLNNYNPATTMKSLLTKEISYLKYNQQHYNMLATLQKERKIQTLLQSIKSIVPTINSKTIQKINGAQVNSLKSSLDKLRKNLTYPFEFLANQTKILSTRTQKNIEWWRQKQRVMTKRKSSRKKARFKNIKKSIEEKLQAGQPVSSLITEHFAINSNNLEGVEARRGMINYQIPEIELNYTRAGGTNSLRKKQDTSEMVSLSNNNQKNFKTILRKIFIKKFNSKRSSKGSRYRNMSNNRGFAYVRRPKTNILELDIPGSDTSTLENLTAGLSKDDKRILFSEIKQNLAKNITRYSQEHSDKENIRDFQNLLIKGSIKKSPIQKRSKRTWRKRKRQKFTKNHYKYRKRNIHGFGKLRNLNKKIKRIQAIQELQNWWWNTYLPNYLRNSETYLRPGSADSTYKDSNKLQNYLSNLIKERTNFSKPLSTDKALEIREKIRQKMSPTDESLINSQQSNFLNIKDQTPKVLDGIKKEDSSRILDTSIRALRTRTEGTQGTGVDSLQTPSILNNVYSNLFSAQDTQSKVSPSIRAGGSDSIMENSIAKDQYRSFNMANPTTYTTTNIPFYAGWDESLRKFVVTNRLLSRRDTGFNFDLNLFGSQFERSVNSNSILSQNQTTNVPFTKAPIQGLNEGSFLYLQTEMPFNSYIIDQFIPTNQSFYAPLGWKRFQFRHSLLKNWYGATKNTLTGDFKEVDHISKGTLQNGDSKAYSLFLKTTSISNLNYFNNRVNQNSKNRNVQILQNKRIKKRYKLLKQTPIQLMYVPTGALLNEILPSHYISVFDKQYRIPRNRYLKRYLPKAISGTNIIDPAIQDSSDKLNIDFSKATIKDLTLLEFSKNALNNKTNQYREYSLPSVDFTLRKKIKPRRKYHKKRFTKKDGLIFPRRQKFTKETGEVSRFVNPLNTTLDYSPLEKSEEYFRLRPSTKAKQTYNVKPKSKKRSPKTLRLRQLRNREFKQVFKPLQRFQPRSGGFVWPGDYLRFEVVPMPKLNSLKLTTLSTDDKSITVPKNKIKRKINVQPVGLLPRKYLIQKHNLKVLKKKLSLSNLT